MCRKLTIRIEDKAADKALSNIMREFDEKTASKALMKLIFGHKKNNEIINALNKEIEQLKKELDNYRSTVKSYVAAKKALEKL